MPPTPTAILEARGSWRAKLRRNEPKPTALTTVPRCPTELLGEARRVWQTTVPLLVGARVLTLVDLPALVDYCRARGEFLALDRYVQVNLDKLRDSPGFPIAVSMRNTARKAMMELGAQFGLTPASRPKIQALEAPVADDPAEEFFRSSTGFKVSNHGGVVSRVR